MLKNVFLENIVKQETDNLKMLSESAEKISFESLLDDMPRTKVNCDLTLESARVFYSDNVNGYFINLNDVEEIKEAYQCNTYRDTLNLIADDFTKEGVTMNNLYIAVKESDIRSMQKENNEELKSRYSEYMKNILAEGVNIALY